MRVEYPDLVWGAIASSGKFIAFQIDSVGPISSLQP